MAELSQAPRRPANQSAHSARPSPSTLHPPPPSAGSARGSPGCAAADLIDSRSAAGRRVGRPAGLADKLEPTTRQAAVPFRFHVHMQSRRPSMSTCSPARRLAGSLDCDGSQLDRLHADRSVCLLANLPVESGWPTNAQLAAAWAPTGLRGVIDIARESFVATGKYVYFQRPRELDWPARSKISMHFDAAPTNQAQPPPP